MKRAGYLIYGIHIKIIQTSNDISELMIFPLKTILSQKLSNFSPSYTTINRFKSFQIDGKLLSLSGKDYKFPFNELAITTQTDPWWFFIRFLTDSKPNIFPFEIAWKKNNLNLFKTWNPEFVNKRRRRRERVEATSEELRWKLPHPRFLFN